MLLALALFLFAAHAHHICDPHGNPDSACPKGAAHSHVHWPEAGDDYASLAASTPPIATPGPADVNRAETQVSLEGRNPEAPWHVPIHA